MSVTEEKNNPVSGTLQVGSLVIDTQNQSVTFDGEVLDLPDLSYRLLLSLIHHAPHRVSKDQLIEEVWQGTVVSDETLTQRIKLLRQALPDDEEQRYVMSIRNQGYRLRLPVSIHSSSQLKLSKTSRKWLTAFARITVLAIVAIWFFAPQNAIETPDRTFTSLAILPFANLSENPDDSYFADGVHEELLTQLSKIEGLDVVSRTSVLPYRSSTRPITEIARELGVDTVIEGSVRRAGDMVRITIQLIDGKEDSHLWAETFERRLSVESLFAIQSEVADAVVEAFELELSGDTQSSLVQLPTVSLEAYDLYLLGRYLTFKLDQEDLQQAVELLSRSITLDPEFAAAWAGLGWAYSFQGSGYSDQSPGDVYDRAREAAIRALSLDPELADAHALYADILTWYDWDWVAAEREYLVTLQLDKYNTLGYALFLTTQLRHSESLELIEKLIDRFPGNEFLHSNAAWRYYNARQYEEALQQAELASGHIDYGSVVGWTLLSTNRHEEALATFLQEYQTQPQNPGRTSNLAVAYARMGEIESSRELLDQLIEMESRQYVGGELIAAIYFELEEYDAGFEWMQQALKLKSRGLIFLQVDHVYDRLRDDPRYLELAAELGF